MLPTFKSDQNLWWGLYTHTNHRQTVIHSAHQQTVGMTVVYSSRSLLTAIVCAIKVITVHIFLSYNSLLQVFANTIHMYAIVVCCFMQWPCISTFTIDENNVNDNNNTLTLNLQYKKWAHTYTWLLWCSKNQHLCTDEDGTHKNVEEDRRLLLLLNMQV